MQLARGELPQKIIDEYVSEYGTAALAIPPNTGGMRAIYAVPIAAIAFAGVGMFFVLKRWRANSREADLASASVATGDDAKRDAYDDRIDAELRDLDD